MLVSLSLGTMRESHYDSIAKYLLKANPTGLEHLDMKGIWLKDSALSTFCSALRRMTQLKHLSVPYLANDQLVEVVSKKCAHLAFIDLSGTSDLSEEALLKLGALRSTLKCIHLGNYSEETFDSLTVAKLMLSLPKLESLGGYQKTGEAVHILKNDLRKGQPTKLKYLHDQGTSFEIMASIQALCPGKNHCFGLALPAIAAV